MTPPRAAQAARGGIEKSGNTQGAHSSTEAAVFTAGINPEGPTTHYRFEYGTQSCATISCASVPVGEGEVPAGTSPKLVKAPVSGLGPLTIYHYRLIASNGAATTGADHIFATYGPSFEG